MDSNKEIGKKSSSLLAQILDSCKNDKLLSITKTHICTLLKYADGVSKMGSATFSSKEEYQEFAIAKFYVDKCISALKTNKVKEIEKGQNLDADDKSRIFDQLVTVNEEIPPLEAFHLSPKERKKRLYDFWQDVKEGEVYHVKVVGITDHAYDLILVNKYLNDERLIDININACMKKSSIKENLNISDLARVSVLAYTTVNSIFKLVVTADPAEIKVKLEDTELGKIPKTDLPFPPIEACKFRSLTQYVTAHCTDRDPEILINNMKSLDIDPYQTYCFLPELDGQKGRMKEKERTEFSTDELQSLKALKEAMTWKDRGDIPRALNCANRALKLNPEYDLAYVLRGSLFEMKAKEKSSSSLLRAVEDYFSALRLNSQCQQALKHISDLLLRSAIMYLDDGAYDKTRENLECAIELQENKEAETLMMELNLYEEKWFDKTTGGKTSVNRRTDESEMIARP